MDSHPLLLDVRETDDRLVVGFGGRDFPDEVFLEKFRGQLEDLLKNHAGRTLAFDLTGVVIIPSTMLGLLLSLRQQGHRVQLLNPSDEVRAVLQITRLDTRFDIEPPAA